MRQIPPLLELAGDMETLCPDAWLINFSNPLPRLTRALTKYSKIRTVGKCHQIEVGYAIVAALLGADYGLPRPADLSLHSGPENLALVHELAAFGRQHFALKAAGLNHFTWMVDVRDRESGEDLYPHMRRVAQDPPPTLEPLSMDLFRIFDLCPVPGDTHLAEYLPWTHDPLARPWERYDLRLYDWSANETRRRERQQQQLAIGRGERSPDELRDTPSEGAVELIEAIQGNLNYYDEAVNIANNGTIPNLPVETIVEVPGFVSSMGVRGIQMDPLPEPIAELLRREAALVELVVDAAVTGDRRLALQALLFDPMVNDVARAEAILDDYLQTFAPQLPQFS
jgi:alpha-galactosidase